MKKIVVIAASLALLASPVLAEEAKTTGTAPAEAKFSTVSKGEMFSSKLKGLNVTNQKDETVGEISDIALKGNQIDALIWKEVHSLTTYQRPEIVAVKSNIANFGAFGFANTIYEDIGLKK